MRTPKLIKKLAAPPLDPHYDYQIRTANRYSGKALDVPSNTTQYGAPPIQWYPQMTIQQEFRLAAVFAL